jgi:glucosamine--fructose-6-phosphate aminotransferase (isomerizing)
MHWLQAQLLGGSMADAVQEIKSAELAVAEYLSNWQAHVASLIPLVSGVQSLFVTGRGHSLATAGTGGLILKESTRLHAEGMSCAAFRHGPMEMAGERVLVVIFEGEGAEASLNGRLADDIRGGGGRAVLIRSNETPQGVFEIAKLPAAVRPIVEILPIQMLSLAIAARDGVEAGRFQRASKITVIP